MKKDILITSAGTGNGFATAESIATNFKEYLNLHIGDINPPERVSASVYADCYFQMPRIDSENYKERTIKYILEHDIDICLPFIDSDILAMSEWYSRKEIPEKIYLQVSSPEVAQICSDKYLAYKWLIRQKLNTPETYLPNETAEFDSLLLKPRNGFGSKVKKVDSNDLLHLNEPQQYILQDICKPPEITIDVFNDFDDDLFFFICRERIETKSGVCTKARLFYDANLGEIAKKISTALRLSFFCFQVMQYNGHWAITDINPRLGAATAMSSVVGMDFYSAMVAKIIGLDYRKFIHQNKEEHFVTRQYRNILTK